MEFITNSPEETEKIGAAIGKRQEVDGQTDESSRSDCRAEGAAVD